MPTVSQRAPHMFVNTRTTYENHFNDTAPYQQVENVRDVGRQLNADIIMRRYATTTDPKGNYGNIGLNMVTLYVLKMRSMNCSGG